MIMKKIFILTSLLLFGLASCQDVNDDFKWLDDETNPKDIVNDSITISATDISTIASKTKGTTDEAYGTQLSKDKMFSDLAPAEILIPYLLPTIFFSPDPGSSVLATYQFKNDRDSLLAGLSTSTDAPAYVLGDKDYEAVWGSPYATALTPNKSPEKQLPILLAANFPDAKDGSYKVIQYAYSTEEPVSSTTVGDIFYKQNFEDLGIAANKSLAINGWLNVDLEGSKTWDMKSYNSNFYIQASSYKSGSKNDNWLIMSPIDLTSATNPHLIFDLKVGNYNSSCLNILVSTDFDGNQANIKSATWDNISSEFIIPTVPTSGYATDFSSSGFGSLIPYKGKKVYIAFRYIGDDSSTTKATTTYQIDNIEVAEAIPGIEVKSKDVVYTAYQKVGGTWKSAETSDLIVLQPEDYTIGGTKNTYFSAAEAQSKISAVLMATQSLIIGSQKVVVYKNSTTSFYADRLTYSAENNWTINSVVETKSSQFILTKDRKWLFDPTLVVTMTASDYQIVVDYVINHQAIENSALVNSYKNTEYYYGFNSNNKNITYREKDRVYDPTYPKDGTEEDKTAFCDKRTIEGLNILLGTKYPDAQPDVSGIEQKAKITTVIFTGPASTNVQTYTYEFQCFGNKEWKYLSRE